jgi:NUMOD3 motif
MRYALFCLLKINDKQVRYLSHHQRFKCIEANREASKTRNHKPYLGKKKSKETLEKLRRAATGKKLSSETIQKIKTNNLLTNESRKLKVSLANKGRVMTDEHKKKISDAIKQHYRNKKNGRS